MATFTGICVKVWQNNPGTGHDEEDNSSKVNNLEKLATNALLSSKRIDNKKHTSQRNLAWIPLIAI